MSEKTELRLIFETAREMGNTLLLESFDNSLKEGTITCADLGMTEAEYAEKLKESLREKAATLFRSAKAENDFACFVACEDHLARVGLQPADIGAGIEEFQRVRRACYADSARFFYGLAQPRWTDWFRRGRRREQRESMFLTACERLREGGLCLEDIGVDQAECDRFMRTLRR